MLNSLLVNLNLLVEFDYEKKKHSHPEIINYNVSRQKRK